jgi:hypothetical protein
MGTLIIGFLAGLISLVLNLVGKYRDYWWWDNLAHYTAGIAIGSTCRQLPRSRSPRDAALISLGISTLWEIAEFEHGAWPYGSDEPRDRQAEDVLLDTILVMAGAWIAARLDHEPGS